ncbi:MAG TPA: ribosomal protein S18-alanine N-acetyltransferase [Candidatus Sulfotelmatobacter sp.]
MSSETILQIRPGTIADIPHVLDLERQSATGGHWTERQYSQAFQTDGPARLLLVAAEASSPPASGLISVKGSGILGFLVAHHLAPEWELENIVVAPAARHRGIGKRLLETLLDAARETNSSAVFLEVRESNTAARTLYEGSGFEQTGRRRSYYTSPSEDAILYRRALA